MAAGERIPVTEVLDEGAACVRAGMAPWVGILWLGALPLKLALVHFLLELADAGADAARHVSYLRELAWVLVSAVVLAAVARCVFVRACHVGAGTPAAPAWASVRPGATEIGACVLTGLVTAASLHLGAWMIAPIPFVASFFGLGFALAHDADRPGALAHLGRIGRAVTATRTPMLLLLVFGLAWLVAFLGMIAGIKLLLWVSGGLATLGGLAGDLAATTLLDPGAPHVLALAASLSLLVLEPFFLAAHVAYVRRLRARHTGEDLRATLARLASRREAAA